MENNLPDQVAQALTAVANLTAQPADWELTDDTPRPQQLYARVRIVPSRTNPRKRFAEDKLLELAENIKKHGMLLPILCRPLPGSTDGALEIIAGERRWRAAGLAGLNAVPVRIIEVNDLDMLELQIVENLQRQDLHELEEAESYEALMNAHKGNSDYGVDEIAAKVGKSRAYVYGRLKLCALSEESREAFYDGKLNASTALLLARLPNATMQAEALETIVNTLSGESMSFRSAADYIKRTFMLRLDQARFPITDATLIPSAGSCRECPKRTGANPDLFSDVGSADVCTDPSCHEQKVAAHADRLRQIAADSGKTIIDGDAAKKIMPYGGDSILKGYVKLDDRCDAAPDRPIADGDQDAIDEAREEYEDYADEEDESADGFVPPANVKPRYREILPSSVLDQAVVLIDPQTGAAIEAVPAKAAGDALTDDGIKDWSIERSAGRSSADTRAENKARREKQRLEIDYRKRLVARIREALAAGEPADDQDGSVRREHTNILAASLFDRSHPHTRRALCEAYSWVVPKYGSLDLATARKRFADLEHDAIGEALLLLIVLPALDIDEYRNPSSVELVDIAASLGINHSTIKKEAAAAARTAKAPKKPAKKAEAKTTTKPKRAARKQPTAASSAAAADEAATHDDSAVMQPAAPTNDDQVSTPTDAAAPNNPLAGLFMRPDMRVKVRDDAVNAKGRAMHQRGWIGTILLVDGTEAKIKWDNGKAAGKLPTAMLDVIWGPDHAAPKSGVDAGSPVPDRASDYFPGDRVQVKADAKGPNGKRLKVCGRKGTILQYASGTAQIHFDDGTSHMQVPGKCLDRLDPAADAYSTEEAA